MIDQEKIHQQCLSDDPEERIEGLKQLEDNFSLLPDKEQAWKDLIQWTSEERNVRYGAAKALGSVFYHVPDKQKAWKDLHKLTNDEDSDVRYGAAKALGSAFSHVPDKEQAWKDLHKLTSDEDHVVRVNANHSLGKVSILKASQTKKDDDYKKELEKAIEFIEKAVQESAHSLFSFNPSQFCLPFYRSFHTIVFKKQEAKEEVDKYLVEAKDAVKGSKSKETLIEAVENLASALKEVQNLKNLDLEAMKGELNYYRQYCDRATELMRDTEETAPFATLAMKKGLPILDRNLKELLEEIQNKAKIVCKESKDTATEEIACAVSREVQKWEIGNQEEMTEMIEGLIEVFRLRMPHLPGYEHIFEEIEGIRDEKHLPKQYEMISKLVGLIPMFSSMPEYVVQIIKEIKEDTTNTNVKLDIMNQKLDNISYGIFKLKLDSHNLISNLLEMKKELEKLSEMVHLNTLSIDKLNLTQAENLSYLKNDLIERLEEIKVIVNKLPNEIDTEITSLVTELKQSDSDILLQRSSGIASIIGLIISLAHL